MTQNSVLNMNVDIDRWKRIGCWVQQGRQSAIILRDSQGQRVLVSNCTCWEVSPESSWRGRQEFWGWEEVFKAP